MSDLYYCRMCTTQIDGFGYCSKRCAAEAKRIRKIVLGGLPEGPIKERYHRQHVAANKLPTRKKVESK